MCCHGVCACGSAGVTAYKRSLRLVLWMIFCTCRQGLQRCTPSAPAPGAAVQPGYSSWREGKKRVLAWRDVGVFMRHSCLLSPQRTAAKPDAGAMPAYRQQGSKEGSESARAFRRTQGVAV